MDSLLNIYNYILPLILLVIGLIFGTIIEKRHFSSIKKREEELLYLPINSFRKHTVNDVFKSKLVNGSVVISGDYFKSFLAFLVNLFGGNIKSYETLVDRARREAILRMKENAKDAKEIVNVKIETSSVSNGAGVTSVEVIAYGTAVY